MNDAIIMTSVALLVGWGLVYGRRRITPGSVSRLLLYGFCSCVTVGAIWLRLLPIMGLPLPSVGEQWMAMAFIALALRWGMELLSRRGVE